MFSWNNPARKPGQISWENQPSYLMNRPNRSGLSAAEKLLKSGYIPDRARQWSRPEEAPTVPWSGIQLEDLNYASCLAQKAFWKHKPRDAGFDERWQTYRSVLSQHLRGHMPQPEWLAQMEQIMCICWMRGR